MEGSGLFSLWIWERLGSWEVLVCPHHSCPSSGQGSQGCCLQGHWLLLEYLRVLKSHIQRVSVLNHLFIGEGEKKSVSAGLLVIYFPVSLFFPSSRYLVSIKMTESFTRENGRGREKSEPTILFKWELGYCGGGWIAERPRV